MTPVEELRQDSQLIQANIKKKLRDNKKVKTSRVHLTLVNQSHFPQFFFVIESSDISIFHIICLHFVNKAVQ
jgi:hypothetical protein